MNIVRVASWSELQEAVYTESWNEEIRRFRSRYAFRGLPDEAQQLRTSLSLMGSNASRLEAHLLRNFRKYARHLSAEPDTIWNWLALAQHHGLPTRLMDWTYSPLVAMHFATVTLDAYDTDGVIWAINYRKAHEMLPDPLRLQLESEGADVFTVEMLTESVATLTDFDTLTDAPFLLFLEPPSIDERIVNQYALFAMLNRLDTTIDAWLETYPDLWRKIVIPASLKWEVRDKLDQANITERVLYPGLDGLSRWLKRHYADRPS